MITLQVKYAVLTHAAEDCSRLWYAVWTVMAATGDVLPEGEGYDEAIPAAQGVLQEFIRHGLILLMRGDVGHPGMGADQEFDIATEEYGAALSTPRYWRPPQEDAAPDEEDYLCFYVTEKGRETWRRGSPALASVLASVGET